MNYNAIIYTILSGTAAVTALVGTKIYPVTIDQDQGAPAIAFRKSVTPVDTKGNATKIDNIEIEINIVADDPDEADDIAREVRTALDNRPQQTVSGYTVSRIQFLSQLPKVYSADENLYMIPLKFGVKVWLA